MEILSGLDRLSPDQQISMQHLPIDEIWLEDLSRTFEELNKELADLTLSSVVTEEIDSCLARGILPSKKSLGEIATVPSDFSLAFGLVLSLNHIQYFNWLIKLISYSQIV